MIEALISATLLGLVAIGLVGGLIYGISEARGGKMRGGAAAWVDAEVDFFRLQGYDGLADDVTLGARTLTATTGYTTYGALAEPRIPDSFNRAVVRVENVTGYSVRKVTVTLYETAGSTVYTTVSTYVGNFTYGP